MKVASKRGSGRSAASIAAWRVAIALTLLAGAGIVPMGAASAQVAESGQADRIAGSDVLQPVTEAPKTEELREPSGLEVIETQASGVRTPTVVRRVTRPATRTPAAAPAATAAPAAVPAAPATTQAGWSSAKVSWYGPGFYGNTMAGGGVLTPSSMVVAHRTLPFGTRIEFSYNGRTCIAVVQDRGPHVSGRIFDLGPGTARTLGFSGVGTVQYRIL